MIDLSKTKVGDLVKIMPGSGPMGAGRIATIVSFGDKRRICPIRVRVGDGAVYCYEARELTNLSPLEQLALCAERQAECPSE